MSIPIYKRRKPGLGNYSGTRKEWRTAWTLARQGIREGTKPDPKDKGLLWKASLIAAYDRHPYVDPLAMGAPLRLEADRMVRSILAEQKHA